MVWLFSKSSTQTATECLRSPKTMITTAFRTTFRYRFQLIFI